MVTTRIPCVGAVVRDARGRLLLVRRGHEPGMGQWSVPGGRIEDGETPQDAIVREVLEETGLRIELAGLAGVVERPAGRGTVYTIQDFYGRVAPGCDPESVRAGDDAAEAGWFTAEQVRSLNCVDGLLDELQLWHVVPRQRRRDGYPHQRTSTE
jgi:8-oxo-dGTP diphosphatase